MVPHNFHLQNKNHPPGAERHAKGEKWFYINYYKRKNYQAENRPQLSILLAALQSQVENSSRKGLLSHHAEEAATKSFFLSIGIRDK